MTHEELIQYFKPRFKCRISDGINIGEAEWFLEHHPDQSYDPLLDFDVWLPTYGRNLQRDLCWTHLQKSNLIISILKDVKIPSLTIVQVRDRKAEHPLVWQIIDGKQRFTTILGFLRNEFPIVLDWEHTTESSYYYNDLPEELQKKIKWFDFHANMIYSNICYDVDEAIKEREFVTDKDKVELYLYINYSGTPQEQNYMDELNGLVR
jgi:hypothetical protein